jgi:hypothetical protein
MAKGFLYLVVIMDWVSRAVLAWRLSNTLGAEFCVEALEEALSRYGKPEIFDTDQGSQFTGDDFTGTLNRHGVAISMDGKGRYGQHLRRAAVAQPQIRGGLPHRLFDLHIGLLIAPGVTIAIPGKCMPIRPKAIAPPRGRVRPRYTSVSPVRRPISLPTRLHSKTLPHIYGTSR